jgi:bifunctional DNA-binding transcriptional regulator/antitoxin component of YhaV-PrlF toxin-antitoxin module
MRITDAVWTATALLHREHPKAEDFAVQEIVSRAVQEKLVGGFRAGLQAHVSGHCVANKKPNGGRHRMLYETRRGHRRLLRTGDASHPDRNGDIRPHKTELPAAYQALVDWYDGVYSRQSATAAPAVSPAPATAPHQLLQNTNASNAGLVGFDEMQSATAFIGPGGTVVLPEFLQQQLGLKEGSCLSIYRDKERVVLLPITDEFIRSLRGSCKGDYSLVEDREREHRIEKHR